MMTDATILKSPRSQLYREYASDVDAMGWAVFASEGNARSFAETYEAETSKVLKVAHNRDGRWVVSQ